jgi:hypothetical protein
MPIDRKYGRVTVERGDIGEDEPVVVFRAQDVTLPDVIDDAARRAVEAGSPQAHLDGLLAAKAKVEDWQAGHYTKIPGAPREETGDDD